MAIPGDTLVWAPNFLEKKDFKVKQVDEYLPDSVTTWRLGGWVYGCAAAD